jgi:FKBP-type peptidyl-prolyl cis-trans isomerase
MARLLLCAAAGGTTAAVSGCGALVAVTHPTPTPLHCAKAQPSIPDDVFATSVALQPAANGLRFGDIKVGSGPVAQVGQVVTLQYTGWFQSGCEFDTSRVSGHVPLQFQLGGGQIIPGLEFGAVGMKVGGKRRLEIPPGLAFGAAGRPPLVPPNATLIMNIELVSVR